MARSIDISDDLFDRFTQRFGSTHLTERVESMMERALSDPSVDALTGTRSRHSLEYDIYSAVDSAARSEKKYVESFLCCDIDNFGNYADYHGFGASDQLLVQLADRLKALGKPVYRHAGDEFVVLGQPEIIRTLGGLGADVRQCVVDVNLSIDKTRRRRSKSWIMLHLHQGCTQPAIEGNRIVCRSNSS